MRREAQWDIGFHSERCIKAKLDPPLKEDRKPPVEKSQFQAPTTGHMLKPI